MIKHSSLIESDNLEEPTFLKTIREKSAMDFKRMGIPDAHSEDWKYTPVRKFLPLLDSLEDLREDIKDKDPIKKDWEKNWDRFRDLDSYRLVFWNGIFQADLSDKISDSLGHIESIESGFNREEFKMYFNSLEELGADGFPALNTSLFDRGIFIQIHANQKLDKPIQLIYITENEIDRIIHPRNLILIGKFSEVEIVENFLGIHHSQAIFENRLSEIFLEQGAGVEHTKVQRLGKGDRMIMNDFINQKKDSQYRSHTYSLSGKFIRNNLKINLQESGSEAHLYGFYSLHSDELMDNHTLVRHLKPHCSSNELYKGVLSGKSIGVFNGKVLVCPDAQKTNAYQQNQTILMDKDSTMNSKPELEIFADDVKCSHGSTMGQLDKMALFYLRSRGISEKSAQNIMVKAYAFSLLNEIKNEEVLSEIENLLNQLEHS